MKSVEILIIGAGPAGLAAAISASEAGAGVMVIDESYRSGGQYLRPRISDQEQPELISKAHATDTEFLMGSPLWFLDPDARVAQVGDAQIAYAALIIATGAYDRPVAVIGSRMEGVYTAGAAQALSKDGVRLGESVLIAGSGPFVLPVAEEVLRTGARVSEIALSHAPLMVKSAFHEPAILREALHYGAGLVRNRIPVRTGWMLSHILGESRVEGAVLTAIGRRAKTSTRTVECDTVAMGYGFLPQLAVSDLAGCKLRFDSVHRTWFTEVDDRLETSVSGVFAAGEGVGIGGHRKAIAEGALAGYGAARAAGHHASTPSSVKRKARRLGRFADAARTALAPPETAALAAHDATVCRCEEVNAGEVRQAVSEGALTVSGVRSRNRAGMGPCQGRICAQVCAELISAQGGDSIESAGRITTRLPARPVSLEDFAR